MCACADHLADEVIIQFTSKDDDAQFRELLLEILKQVLNRRVLQM